MNEWERLIEIKYETNLVLISKIMSQCLISRWMCLIMVLVLPCIPDNTFGNIFQKLQQEQHIHFEYLCVEKQWMPNADWHKRVQLFWETKLCRFCSFHRIRCQVNTEQHQCFPLKRLFYCFEWGQTLFITKIWWKLVL